MKGMGLLVQFPSVVLEEGGRLDGEGETLCGPIELPQGFTLSNIRINGDLIVSSRCRLVNVSVFGGSLITREDTDKVTVEWGEFDNRRGAAVSHAGIGLKIHGAKLYGKVGFDQCGAGRTNLRHCEFYATESIHQSFGFIHVTNSEFFPKGRSALLVGGSLLSQHNHWSRKTRWWNRSAARTIDLISGVKFRSQNDSIEGRWLVTPSTCPDLRRPTWSTAATTK